MNENINPEHYKGTIECIDAIEEVVRDLQGIEATDTGNIIKYMWRWKRKNGVEDLLKAKWYINHLIGYVAGGEEVRKTMEELLFDKQFNELNDED